MMVRFTAPNVVAMILFIPLLLALGVILAFIVPLLALMAAVAGIVFLCLFVFAKIGLVKKQVIAQPNSSSGFGDLSRAAAAGKAKKKRHVEIKEYRLR